jgi:hypothetical protein
MNSVVPVKTSALSSATLRRLSRVWVATAVVALGLLLTTNVASASGLSIKVVGNHLVNQDGQTIRLLGVDRSGAQYMCVSYHQVFDGPSDRSSVAAMAAWHINAVRVPLNEDCWLGINGVVTGGAAYRHAIVKYVKTLESFGIYVILDLHWAAPGAYQATSQWPMPDADHAPTFWRSMARTFKANHGVLFDLFNEPFVTSWPCWLHGCQAAYGDDGKRVSYQTAGMQQLVNAVRETGATTPLMLGGLASSSNEAGWRQFEPNDPDHQLVVSFHNYKGGGCDNVTCWDRTIAPLAQVVPVVTDELGEPGCADNYDLRYMPWADAHGVSYLGWTWNSTDSGFSCAHELALIVNYDGQPTAYGVGLKDHLAELAAAG